jgi:hypothetical protein
VQTRIKHYERRERKESEAVVVVVATARLEVLSSFEEGSVGVLTMTRAESISTAEGVHGRRRVREASLLAAWKGEGRRTVGAEASVLPSSSPMLTVTVVVRRTVEGRRRNGAGEEVEEDVGAGRRGRRKSAVRVRMAEGVRRGRIGEGVVVVAVVVV